MTPLIGRFLYKNEYSDKDIVWVKPKLVGNVQYMHTTETGSMRQPVWKGLKTE